MSKLTQQQKTEQSLSLTPAQIQAIKMLELTGLELEARIEHELEENPALEENYDEASTSEDSPEEHEDGSSDQDWELGEYASEDDIPDYKLRELQERQSFREEIPFAAGAPSLDELLLSQLELATPLTERTREVARYIRGNISEDGYLTRTAGELRQRAELVLGQHYEDFVNKRFDKLRSALSIDETQLAELYDYISHLNPKPGNGLSDGAEGRLAHFTPDFIVTERGGELLIFLTEEREIPALRLSPTYLRMLEENKARAKESRQSREAMTFLKHKVEQARWFIDALQQRQHTLRTTMAAIVAHQRAFFLSGEVSDLRPMNLRDIAEATGLDISTISRVSNSKSVQTDFGVYMLKFFFGEGMLNDEGESISTREIKKVLTELIEGEDKRAPYSDERLTELLSERGYPIARRTVAKYREQLHLPVARLRRALPSQTKG